MERRRQIREQAAQGIYESPNDCPAAWEQLRPVIDAAMLQLTERDRMAVLLRFFEHRPFAEIGLRLGLSENTARMRVERALEALRGTLAKRGIVSTATALGLMLTSQAITAAPAGLVSSVSAAALASVVVGNATFFMSTTIVKAGALIVTLTAGSIGLIFQHRSNSIAQAEIERLRPQAQAVAQLRAENAHLTVSLGLAADEHAELLRLRQEVDDLSHKLSQVTPGEASPASGSWSTAVNAPILATGNVGNGTPQSGIQTMYWAIHNLNAEAFAQTLYLGSAQADWDTAFANLTEAERQQFGSPAMIIAQEFLSNPSALKQIIAMQVLQIERQDDDNVILRVNLQDVTGKIREDITLFHHSDAGWQVPLPVSEVKKSLARFLTKRS
jgi:DNA-binding Lrp family transcriptional regulator